MVNIHTKDNQLIKGYKQDVCGLCGELKLLRKATFEGKAIWVCKNCLKANLDVRIKIQGW